MGRPENVVPTLIRQFQSQGDKVEGVWLQREVRPPISLLTAGWIIHIVIQSASEEQFVEHQLDGALKDLHTPFHLDPGARTLVHESDLPFSMPNQLPDVFSAFRKRVEGLNEKMIRRVLPEPTQGNWRPFPSLQGGGNTSDEQAFFSLPSEMTETRFVEQLVAPLTARPVTGDGNPSLAYHEIPGTAFPFKGGESSARQRLEHYMGVGGAGVGSPAVTYKDTRNGLLGTEYSTKFSPYLTFGCLSAREIAAHCDDLENRLRGAGKLDEAARKNIYWIK